MTRRATRRQYYSKKSKAKRDTPGQVSHRALENKSGRKLIWGKGGVSSRRGRSLRFGRSLEGTHSFIHSSRDQVIKLSSYHLLVPSWVLCGLVDSARPPDMDSGLWQFLWESIFQGFCAFLGFHFRVNRCPLGRELIESIRTHKTDLVLILLSLQPSRLFHVVISFDMHEIRPILHDILCNPIDEKQRKHVGMQKTKSSWVATRRFMDFTDCTAHIVLDSLTGNLKRC